MTLASDWNLDSHLYSPPMFRSDATIWRSSLTDVLRDTPSLTLDCTSIASIISNGFVPADRTLWKEIRRRPWLSRLTNEGSVDLLPVPPHGLRLRPAPEIARELVVRLEREAMGAVHGRSHIYLLLSGGLDSRVVAGVLKRLEIAGQLPVPPICLTWGLPDSRDVLYARRIAEAFNWQWTHAPLSIDDLKHNTLSRTPQFGCLLSPVHYHAMSWFDSAFPKAVVLAGSYGDSVGRAEFSGRHLLELAPLGTQNSFGLLTSSAFAHAATGLHTDLEALQARVGDRPPYGVLESQQQSFYMRNLIGLAMSSIDAHAETYQMFTHPDVFGYVWSLHPACRTDAVYAEALELLDPQLARTPWARTNRALHGRSQERIAMATQQYHNYTQWAQELAVGEFSQVFDPQWFTSTGVFTEEGCNALRRVLVHGSEHNPTTRRAAEVWLWMVSLRLTHETLGARFSPSASSRSASGISIASYPENSPALASTREVRDPRATSLRDWVPPGIRTQLKKLRRVYLRHRALRAYPPAAD